MVDRKSFRRSEMSSNEAWKYSSKELGEKLGPLSKHAWKSMGHNSIRNFVQEYAYDERIDATEFKGGIEYEATLGDKIINPKKIPGRRPRMWFKNQDTLVIYMKKENLFYRILFNV